jgi:Lar family restriction alleviation protein
MRNHELKSCPFCNGRDTAIKVQSKAGNPIYFAECNICHSKGAEKGTEEEAIEVWNTRPSMQEIFEKMLRQSEYCSNYQTSKGSIEFSYQDIPVNVISFLSQTDEPINALFLESTEDLIGFETPAIYKEHKCSCGHHHHH